MRSRTLDLVTDIRSPHQWRTMDKRFRNKYLAITIIALFTFAVGVGLYLWHYLSASGSTAGLDKTIQQMREHPGDWKAEKDFSGLMADFKANDIAAVGI